jgi:hypothetical protein
MESTGTIYGVTVNTIVGGGAYVAYLGGAENCM